MGEGWRPEVGSIRSGGDRCLSALTRPGGGGVVEIPMAMGFFGLYLVGYLMVKKASRNGIVAGQASEVRLGEAD